jgi:hypothetical protein
VTLFITTSKTPIGNLNLIADEHVLLGANLSNISALKAGLDDADQIREIKVVKSIPIISDLISDYFDGDIAAINGISVRQPGATFSQAAWKVSAPRSQDLVVQPQESATFQQASGTRNAPSGSMVPPTAPCLASCWACRLRLQCVLPYNL